MRTRYLPYVRRRVEVNAQGVGARERRIDHDVFLRRPGSVLRFCERYDHRRQAITAAKFTYSHPRTGNVVNRVAMSQARAAGGWIEGQADRAEGKRILGELPRLPRGEGFLWAPSDGGADQGRVPADSDVRLLTDAAARGADHGTANIGRCRPVGDRRCARDDDDREGRARAQATARRPTRGPKKTAPR
jgi:hypothetical protein